MVIVLVIQDFISNLTNQHVELENKYSHWLIKDAVFNKSQTDEMPIHTYSLSSTQDITQISKVSAHVRTSGWGNQYRIVK